MKIDYIRIENFGGIKRLDIQAGGNNVVISGENGAGKSTVANAVSWLFTGKMFDGLSREPGRIDGGKYIYDENTAVEIQLTDGQTIRREKNGKSVFFVNGAQVKTQKDFDGYLYSLTRGVMEPCMFPFSFFKKRVEERRNIILPLAGKLDDKEFMAAEKLAELKEYLKGMTPAQFVKYANDEIKRLSAQVKSIPAKVEENQRLIVDEEKLRSEIEQLDAEISEIKKQIADKQNEMNEAQNKFNENWQSRDRVQKKKDAKNSQLLNLEASIERNKETIENAEMRLKNLRLEYLKIKKSLENGVCPVCGQKWTHEDMLPEDTPRGAEVLEEGKLLNQALDDAQKSLPKQEERRKKLQEEIDELAAELNKPYDLNPRKALIEVQRQMDELRGSERDLDRRLAELNQQKKANVGNRLRIEDLIAEEKKVNAEIVKLEGQLAAVNNFITQRIKYIEGKINEQFEFVTFRMFAAYKSTEGEKPDCEPLLNGVPYSSLSKGEKFKAAMDILRTLQKFHGVEFPIFIDDAESYTENSIIDLPNQVFWLKVVSGVKELTITVEEKGREVAA